MLRATYRLAVLSVLVSAGSVGYWYFHNPQSPGVRIEKLEEEKRELQQIVRRLTDERRVAEMIVTGQTQGPKGLETTLLFVEQSRDGTPLPARTFTVVGDEIYIAGLSIRFRQDFVMNDDPLRGRGIMLFTHLFGKNQRPADGPAIDTPGQIPELYRDPKETARVTDYERELWANFWKLTDDPKYRAE